MIVIDSMRLAEQEDTVNTEAVGIGEVKELEVAQDLRTRTWNSDQPTENHKDSAVVAESSKAAGTEQPSRIEWSNIEKIAERKS